MGNDRCRPFGSLDRGVPRAERSRALAEAQSALADKSLAVAKLEAEVVRLRAEREAEVVRLRAEREAEVVRLRAEREKHQAASQALTEQNLALKRVADVALLLAERNGAVVAALQGLSSTSATPTRAPARSPQRVVSQLPTSVPEIVSTVPPPSPQPTDSVQPATQPPLAAASPGATASALNSVETDDAAIRRVIRILEQAIETKDIGLYRAVRPGLTQAGEAILMNTFREVESEIDIRVENLRIEGRTAVARLVRRDTLVRAGRRQVQNSTQTLRLEKTEAGWIIVEP